MTIVTAEAVHTVAAAAAVFVVLRLAGSEVLRARSGRPAGSVDFDQRIAAFDRFAGGDEDAAHQP